MPLNLKNLPHEGYSERENSDAVNQIIQFAGNVFGGTRNVQSFTVPANHFETVGAFRVNDPNVKAGSFIILDGTNAAAITASVGVTLTGDGFFEVNDPPPELMFAAAQVIQGDGSLPGGISGPTLLPFDTIFINENWNIDLVLNRITSIVFGTIEMAFSVSGIYATGRTYEFGVRVFDQFNVLKSTISVFTSTGNQNDVVTVSAAVLTDTVIASDYIEMFGDASGAAVPFNYDLALSLKTISPVRGQIVTNEVIFDYAIIQ